MNTLDGRVKHTTVHYATYSTTGYKAVGIHRPAVTFDVTLDKSAGFSHTFFPNNLTIAQAKELVAALQHSITLAEEN